MTLNSACLRCFACTRHVHSNRSQMRPERISLATWETRQRRPGHVPLGLIRLQSAVSNRREFLRLLVGTAACAVTPTVLLTAPQPDVRGWHFGVWTLQGHCGVRHGQKYWCRCDCGAERVVSLSHLLSMDALSCDHVRVRGYFCLGPDARFTTRVAVDIEGFTFGATA